MLDFPFLKKLRKNKNKISLKNEIEPHDVLLDSLIQKKEKEIGISEKKLEVPILKIILQGFFILFLFLIFILFAKTFQFQIIEGEEFLALLNENKFIINQIQAERGIIYDNNLKQLVLNEASFDLICSPSDLPGENEDKLSRDEILKEISEICQKDFEILKKEVLEKKDNSFIVSENLDHQTLIRVEARIDEFPGFQVKKNTIRNYPEGEVFAHLIGYTGRVKSEELKEDPDFYSITDYVGRDGLEKFYEETLRKNSGKLQIERDAVGNILSKEIIQYPESGNNLVLWLDSSLQKKVKEELALGLERVSSKKGVAVALDPKTGGVLAMVSLPSFDNNLFNQKSDTGELERLLEDPYELKPLFNRAVSGRYLTGSTIKPLIASAALEEDLISPDKNIYCEGKITIDDYWDPEKKWDYKDWETHGWTNLRKAIAESCNVFFYTIGGGYKEQEGLGPTRIKKYLQIFGWDSKTGIDLPGEVKGFIPDKEWKKEKMNQGWWDGDTYLLSIGQGYLLISPLEVVSSFAAIANGGKLLKPLVVQKIIDKENNIIEEKNTEVIRENFIDSENLKIIREGMRQAVTGINSPHASAVVLNSLPVSAAAKTGTAELGNDHYHNWVTVFAPYEDPQIVLTVVIENIDGIKAAALPVARAILDWYFSQPK